MNGATWVAISTASLLGSLHCAGMCGPFVAAYAGDLRADDAKSWRAHLGYHLGRLATYATLGGLAGGLGAAVNFAFERAGWVETAALLASLGLVAAGLRSLLPRTSRPSSERLARVATPLLRLGTRPRNVRAPLLGLITPLLPCGWLYAFVLLAAGSGSVLEGALSMIVFWAGTVPALLGVGVLLGHLGARLRARLPVLLGIVWLTIGLWGVASRALHPVELVQAPLTASASPDRPACHGGRHE